jgi:hypothetical protein
MRDVTLEFDAFLTRTLTDYAEGGVAPIDAVAIATAAEAQGRGGVLGRPSGHRVGGRAALVPSVRAALVIAAAALALIAIALVGSLLLRLIQPPAAHTVVIMTGATTPCSQPDGGTTGGYELRAIDLDAATGRSLAVVCRQPLISADADYAAVFDDLDTRDLVRVDLRTGAKTRIAALGGLEAQPSTWSPKGTYLYWSGQRGSPDEPGFDFGGFVSSADGSSTARLPLGEPADGVPSTLVWTPDDTRVLFSRADGTWWVGAGAGTDFRQLTAVGSGPLAMSPDGRKFAFPVDPAIDTGTISGRDIAVGDGFSPPTATRSFGVTKAVWAPTWVPDGSAVAVVVSNAPHAESPETVLELLDPKDLQTRAHFELPAIGDPTDVPIYGIKLSPDGRYAAVSRHTITRDAQGLETHREWFVIVRLSDGAFLPTARQRVPELTAGDGWIAAPLSDVFFSPDSRRLVYHVPFSLQVLDLDGQGHRHIGLPSVGEGAWAGQLAWDAAP